jgi:hypothetical protein
MPSHSFKAANASHPDLNAFCAQQFAFDLQISAVSTERPASGNHAMTWDGGVGTLAHDVANGARGARFARKRGDIAVRGDTAGRNTSYGGQDPVGELTGAGARC